MPSLAAALPTLVVALVLTGAACVLVIAATPDAGRPYVAWSSGAFAIGLSVALAALAYLRRREQRVRAALSELDAQVAQLTSDAVRLADQTVPGIVKRLRDGASAEVALAELPASVDGAHYRVARMLADEIGRRERMRAAAMSACANAAGRVQALATSMLADLREMEGRHDESVLGDLLKLDHSTAQAGRLADSIAVLTGARSGRRWTKPIVMESILRGAVGRISAYQRVRVHSTSNVAIAGYAAEGIMHALAELMDNATNFSPPTEEVHVYVEDTQNGVIITIEDGGLVMGPAAQQRAEEAVSAETLDLTTLSGTRLGLAVVGSLARKHGLTVSFRPSSRGGTGVVVMVPRQLVAQARHTTTRGSTFQPRTNTNTNTGTSTSTGTGFPTSAETQTGPSSSSTSVTPSSSSGASPADAWPSEGSPSDGSPLGSSDPFEGGSYADVSHDGRYASASHPDTSSPDGSPFPDGSPPGDDRGLLDLRDTGDDEVRLRHLPKRRRGETLAAAPQPPAAPQPRPRPRVDPGSRFSAFRDASRRRNGGASGADSPTEHSAPVLPEDEDRTR